MLVCCWNRLNVQDVISDWEICSLQDWQRKNIKIIYVISEIGKLYCSPGVFSVRCGAVQAKRKAAAGPQTALKHFLSQLHTNFDIFRKSPFEVLARNIINDVVTRHDNGSQTSNTPSLIINLTGLLSKGFELCRIWNRRVATHHRYVYRCHVLKRYLNLFARRIKALQCHIHALTRY